MATPPFLRRLLLTALAAAFVASVPAAAADPTYLPVPGPGFVGTPPSVTVPQVCDPLRLVCVGPIVQLLPVFVGVQADGFLFAVYPDGAPASDIGPFYNNVTVPVTETQVPLVFCPDTCHVPAQPTAGWGGTVYVFVDGPVPCLIEINVVGVNPHCIADSDGDGLPDDVDNDPFVPFDYRQLLPPCSEPPLTEVASVCYTGSPGGFFLTNQGVLISTLLFSITI